MASPEARAQKVFQAAQEASPGEKVEGLFHLRRCEMPDELQTPCGQRPRVLDGRNVKSAPFHKAGDILARTLILDFLGPKKNVKFRTSAEYRAEARRRSTGTSAADDAHCQFFGPAASDAGRLLVATLPRSKANVQHLLCVTQSEIKLLYTPYTRRIKHYANVIEVGWRTDRKNLEWTRSTVSKYRNQGIQYGFADGSWLSLYTFGPVGLPEFTEVFPHVLTKEDPIPPNAHYPDYPEPTK